MAWKPITIVEFSQFQQCIALPQSDGHQLSQRDLDIVSNCFQSVFTEGEEPPDPPDPPQGDFAPCGDNVSARGTGDWDEWCVDETRNFVSPGGGVMEMESNAQATRSRLPGTTGRAIAPPTAGSNRVVMECDLKFPQGWLDPLSLGGQHLFVFGEGPFRLPGGGTSDDHIRFDFGCFDVGGGNGFADGFRVLIYSQKSDVRQEVWFPSTTKMPGVFRADTWTRVKADGRYDPQSGKCDLTLTIAGISKTVTASVAPGITPKLGDSIGWGNVDGRPGRVAIRNLTYRTA